MLTRGKFGSREEALDAGVELLRKRDELIDRLRESRRQLDAGEFADYNDDSITVRFDELKRRVLSREGE
jgi:Arc/MetJ-type ribon-helix-helix transcriptional regulator